MGERTFGKGSIQQLKEMRDGSALKYTIGEYLTPGDISIQSIGVVPDVQLVPMIIGKKDVDIFFSDEDVFRESDLDRHLVSDRTIQELKPKETVEYVFYSKGEDKNVCPVPFEKIVKDDYEVKVAHDLLTGATTSNRPKMLKDAAGFLSQARLAQSDELGKALKKLKVEWEECGGDQLPPASSLKVEYYENNKKVTGFSLKAGSKPKIRVDVKNDGSAPVCRLYALTKSDNKLLSKREFIFGKILPGKKKSWEVEIEVPESSASRIDPVLFDFYTYPEHKVLTAPEIRASVETVGYPAWHVAYEVVDTVKGNGNGVLEAGEEGKLMVHVRNGGKGKSKSLAVSIKNMSGEGVYITKGRESIKGLAPGKESTVELKIKLLSSYAKDDFRLKVLVQDADFPAFYQTEADLPAKAKGGPKEPKAPLVFDNMPVITITSTESPAGGEGGWSVKTNSITLKGTVEDDRIVEDMYIYEDVDKIFYKSNEGSASPAKMEFEAVVPLHGGINIITIFARQDSTTMSMKKLIVRRDNADGTTMPTPEKSEEDKQDEEGQE